MKRRIPKQKVFNLINKWKKKLKIQEYQIEIVFSSPDKHISKKRNTVKEEPLYAEINVVDFENKSFILILYDFNDIENTILHELLHVKFWDEFEDEGFEHLLIENIVRILI